MTGVESPLVPPWVPSTLRSLVDVDELAPEREDLVGELGRLSRCLGAHVAAYRKTAKGRALGLCAIYEAASLTDTHLALLREFEARWPEVLFVAYAAPLKIRRA